MNPNRPSRNRKHAHHVPAWGSYSERNLRALATTPRPGSYVLARVDGGRAKVRVESLDERMAITGRVTSGRGIVPGAVVTIPKGNYTLTRERKIRGNCHV